jgi:hypothetical protein
MSLFAQSLREYLSMDTKWYIVQVFRDGHWTNFQHWNEASDAQAALRQLEAGSQVCRIIEKRQSELDNEERHETIARRLVEYGPGGEGQGQAVPPAPFVINVECVGMTSFHDTQKAVELAKRLGCYIRTTLCGKEVVIHGTEDPHDLYRKLTSTVENGISKV